MDWSWKNGQKGIWEKLFENAEDSYRYILSGSLLGVDLKDIRSVPVGYMDIVEMYPLDFEEFLWANEVAPRVIEELEKSFSQRLPVPDFVHEKMMEIYRLYCKDYRKHAALNHVLGTGAGETDSQTQSGWVKIDKTFVLAHRLSTIKNSDMILVMKDGYYIKQRDPWNGRVREDFEKQME